jgi:uncharacterized protein YggE
MKFPSIAGALALVALAIAVGSIALVGMRPQTTVAQSNVVPIRQITVVGQGDASGTPDTASVQIGVQSEAATSREALTDNNGKMAALIAKLKELGVAEKDIQTSNLSIYPRYDNDGKAIIGYQVSNMVSIKIRNLADAGSLLDQVVSAGANNLSGIMFMIDDTKALEGQARDAAIADARARAQAMAQAAGGSVGQVLNITENIGSTPVPLMMERAAVAADAAGSVPIQSGEQTINASVQITFELR